jgi:DNA polymerase-3 subunit delta'
VFKKLIGNEPAKLGLRRLLTNARLPNSLIFAGDEGVGKRQFALQVAKAFVCREPVQGEPCNVCPACRRAEVFQFTKSEKGDDYDVVFFSEHPDVGMVIPFKRNVRVGSIRALEKEANFRPYEAQARFFIIDDAEKMNDSAANALLKTLEEPPSSTYIILITSRADSLLATIRSRCQLIRFAPVEPAEIEQFLIEDRAFSHDEARLAARFSRGSVGRAVSIDVEDFRTRRERMLEVLRGVIETSERARSLKISEEMNDAKNKDRFEENLDILESLIHDVWSMQISADAARLTNADMEAELSRLAEMAVGADLNGWLRQIEQIRMDLIVNINRRIATDALFVTMAGS